MNLEELINTWKNQDMYIEKQMRMVTMQYLFKEKSKNALENIKKCLLRELLIIVLCVVCFDVLFVLIKIPFTPVRWICFTVFNITILYYITFYLKAVRESKLNYSNNLESNLQRIVLGLTQFRNQYKIANIPIAFVCILMFAGSQDLFILMPWMIFEVLLWRWMLLPKMRSRFQDYSYDLECTLRQLKES